jgi:hypothetical protein
VYKRQELWTENVFTITVLDINEAPITPVFGSIVFSDDFSNGLTKWTGQNQGSHHAIIVSDPLNTGRGGVVAFNELNSAGDIFSIPLIESGGTWNNWTVSFDYLGIPGRGGVDGDLGGFVGLTTQFHDGFWIAGTSPSWSTWTNLIDDHSWRRYSIFYNWNRDHRLMLEDWSGSNGVAGDAMFDNIVVTFNTLVARIPENAPIDTAIATLWTRDPDNSNTFSYSLVSGDGDTDNGDFAVSGNQFVAKRSFDFETKSTYSIRVRSTDQGGLSADRVLTVSITDINEAPTNISLSTNSIAENSGADATVGTLTTTDPDMANTFAYTLVSGTGDSDNAAFNISGTALRASSSFDFETKSSYSVRVRSTDQGGLWTEKVFTISVTDVNETPTNINLSAGSIAENAGANATVGTLTTTDPDAANTFAYTLFSGTGDTDNAAFNISGNALRASSSFDFETKSSYSIRVRSTDQGGLWTENVFTISVTDVNETPTNISLSANSIAENAGANATVGTLTTTDPDAANTFAYTLVLGTGDTDNAAFNISGNALRASSSFDFETKSSYSVRVRSTDQGGLWTEKVFTISVTDVNETPTNINLSAGSIAENSGANATIGTLTTTDPDTANTFAYTLVSGTGDSDNAAFNIDSDKLRASSSFDFETKSSYSVRVRSTDQGGLWTEKVFTISVINTNELVSVSVNGADNFINASQRSQITSVVVVTESVLSDPQTAFSLTNIGLLTASSSSLASSQILVTSVGNVYTLRFGAGAGVVARGGTGARANSLADGNWILTVAGSEVSGTNQFGNRAVDNFFRMFGDSDGDGDVDGTDAVALRRAQSAASYNAALDWDGNGSVTPGADINFFSLNQNKRRRLF